MTPPFYVGRCPQCKNILAATMTKYLSPEDLATMLGEWVLQRLNVEAVEDPDARVFLEGCELTCSRRKKGGR